MTTTLSPREIAALVPMPRLLHALGFDVNERTHRAPCILHGGRNPTAFSWREDGLWYCFNEGRGGDRLALVQAVRKGGFRDAVSFLADLAGVTMDSFRVSIRESVKARRERERLEALALESLNAERVLRLTAGDEVRSLERIRDRAIQRLRVPPTGQSEESARSREQAWMKLKLVAERLPRALAKFYLLSFGSEQLRFAFMRYPKRRDSLIDHVLLAGATDDAGRFVEVAL